jgi:hypothetical protein
MRSPLVILLVLASVAAGRGMAAEQFDPGDSVWIRFGNPDRCHGLYDAGRDSAELAVRAGRRGRKIRNQSLRVDLGFLREPMPVRVVVEYWDESTDWFLLHYAANDTAGEGRGDRKGTEIIHRTDSRAWKEVVFRLPDAHFCGSPWNKDLAVSVDGWVLGNREPLIVTRVEVVKGGVSLAATPEAVSADGVTSATVEALVYDRYGQLVPDGTAVAFTCTAGKIEPRNVATAGGRAAATFTGGTEPGSAEVTASTLEDSASVVIPMLEGRGPIHRATVLLDDFTQPERWQIQNDDDREGALTVDPFMTYRGRPAARWDYRFKRKVPLPIAMTRRTPTPGRLDRLSMWVYHDGQGNGLVCYFHDAANEPVHWGLVDGLWGRGWRWEWQDLGARRVDHHHQPDFLVGWPITLDRIELARWYETPDVGEAGSVYFHDLTAECLVPASSLVWAQLQLAQRWMEAPGRPIPVEARVYNLGDRPYTELRLELAVVDRRGRTVVPGGATFSLEAGEIRTLQYSLRPARYGRQTVEAHITGNGIDSISRETLVIGLAEE